ncbi:MAG: HisA/HisF-related TIM barrel protein [Methylobacter sp.]
MKIIPVIDLKNGVVVHAKQGNREHYQPINTGLCTSPDIFDVIQAFLAVYPFNIFYIADLNAITGQSGHDQLLAEVLKNFPQTTFWIDRGYQSYNEKARLADNAMPVLGSESYCNKTIAELKAFQNNFVLSLDYSNSIELGAKNLFAAPAYWPENIIIMTLERVGSNQGPDIIKLGNFCRNYPDKNFIAAGGVRNKQDCLLLSQAGIKHALVASALHSGNITKMDIAELHTTA